MESIAYNDGRSTGDGDYTGEVFVQIGLEKSDASTAQANQVDIIANVGLAGNSDVSVQDFNIRKRLGRARFGDRVRLTYFWNYTSQVITFRAVNLTLRKVYVWRYRPTPRFGSVVPAKNARFYGNVQTRTIMPYCRPDSGRVVRPMAMIDADFDNIFYFKRR